MMLQISRDQGGAGRKEGHRARCRALRGAPMGIQPGQESTCALGILRLLHAPQTSQGADSRCQIIERVGMGGGAGALVFALERAAAPASLWISSDSSLSFASSAALTARAAFSAAALSFASSSLLLCEAIFAFSSLVHRLRTSSTSGKEIGRRILARFAVSLRQAKRTKLTAK
eukprot:scaffold12068_cov32-Tisochrysis_lutea.AAC.3